MGTAKKTMLNKTLKSYMTYAWLKKTTKHSLATHFPNLLPKILKCLKVLIKGTNFHTCMGLEVTSTKKILYENVVFDVQFNFFNFFYFMEKPGSPLKILHYSYFEIFHHV